MIYKDFLKLIAREYQKSEYFAKQLVKLFYDNELIEKNETGYISLAAAMPF